ncbi:MAG: MotA/TolQ/ExbB proton channel family protein, partial [Nannocystaceae bacterium]
SADHLVSHAWSAASAGSWDTFSSSLLTGTEYDEHQGSGVTSGSEAAGIMTGISEALVATAIGLLVAIPAVIAYNALQRKVKRLMSEAEGLVNVMLATLTDNAALSDGRTPQEQS